MTEQYSDRSLELMHSFWNMKKNIMYFVQKVATNHGLTIPQYSILMMMGNKQELTQKTIREKTLLPKSTLSQAIDGLTQLELLQRQQVEGNRRETLLSVTKKGQLFITNIHSKEDGLHQVFQQAINTISEEQFQNLIETHQTITTHFESRRK